MDHKMNKQEAFQQWSRGQIMQHETGLRNLQDWFFALARVAGVTPEKLAKAIYEAGEQGGFGKNFQLRMKEEQEKAIKAEKEKLEKAQK